MRICISIAIIAVICMGWWFLTDGELDTNPSGSEIPRSVISSGGRPASRNYIGPEHETLRASFEGTISFEEAVVQLRDKEPDREKRQQLLALLAINLAERDPDEAIEKVLTLYKDEAQALHNAISTIFQRLRRRDLSKAAELVKSLPASLWRTQEINGIAGEWPPGNRSEFMKWARGLEFSEDQGTAMAGFGQKVSGTSVEEVELAVSEIDDPRFTSMAVSLKASGMAAQDPQAAISLVEKYDLGVMKINVVRSWARSAPEEAAAYVATQADPGERRRLANAVRGAYSQIDPKGAANWAVTIGNQLEDHKFVRDAIDSWMLADSTSASEWIGAMEPGGSKDHAIHSMVRRLQGRESDETIEAWVDQIQDEKVLQRVRSDLSRP